MREQLAAINFYTGDDRPSVMSFKMQWNGEQYGRYMKMAVNPSQAEIDAAIDQTLEDMVRTREWLKNPETENERVDA
jgi:S-ribosylhomocysteine lyase LuxS involved in autoinducer biosynthesis